LLRSIPVENAILAHSPSQVELFFSEAVDPRLSKLNVLDLEGNVVDKRDARVDPADSTHMTATLNPLSDGVYTVVWRAISATDGHETSGTFPFAVGKVNGYALTGAQSNENSPPPPGEIVVKGILYLVAAVLVGGNLFTSLVWLPSRRLAKIQSEDLFRFDRFSRKLILAALLALGAADVLSLMMEAGHANGTLFGLPWQPAFSTVLLETRLGVLGISRIVLAFMMAGLLLPPANRRNRWAGLAFSLLFLLTFSLESHAAGEAKPFLPLLADWIHLTAVSVWVGGLFSFLGGMRNIQHLEPGIRTKFTSILIPHFTTLALASVGVLTLSGVYSAILRIGTLHALTDTDYGRALLVKLAIALLMILIGAVNIFITTPLMRRAAGQPAGSPGLVTRFRKLLTGEVVLGVLILLWVGLFTTLPPAKVTSTPAGFYQITRVDDLVIAFNVDPNRVGMNTFTATITSAGTPVTDAQSVSLEFTPLSGMMPGSKATLVNQGNGVYSLDGGYFGMPDTWDVKVVVVRQGKFDAYGDFKIDNSATSSVQRISWQTMSLSMIGLTVLSGLFAFRMLWHRPKKIKEREPLL
jgi:copper transport protein